MRAAISYFVDDQKTQVLVDGKSREVSHEKILCVWNKLHGAWMLPGSDTRDGIRDAQGETPEQAQARILRQETGLETLERKKLYNGPNGIIFAVTVRGESRNTGFLTREEFLKASPFRVFYEKKLFAHLDQELAHDARVVVKAKSGKALYAIQLESFRANSDGVKGWWLDPTEYIHATDEASARLEVSRWTGSVKTQPFRILAIGLAIGFKVESETGKGKVLVA